MYKTFVKAAALLQVLTILSHMTAITQWRGQFAAAVMLLGNDDYSTNVIQLHRVGNVLDFICKITHSHTLYREVVLV